MGSSDPTQAFNQMLAASPDAQRAMELIRQYGNGNPETAFMSYAASQGKQALGQEILRRMGLR